jgi:hypothetical protein
MSEQTEQDSVRRDEVRASHDVGHNLSVDRQDRKRDPGDACGRL